MGLDPRPENGELTLSARTFESVTDETSRVGVNTYFVQIKAKRESHRTCIMHTQTSKYS